MISGSRQLVTGVPFDDSAMDSPLWADVKAKVAKLEAEGQASPAAAAALLADARAAILNLRPAYERVIAWAQSDIGQAPSGRVGRITSYNVCYTKLLRSRITGI